jgi:uridine phosphorylase
MCGIGDVAKYVLLSSDPRRIDRISSFFDEAKKLLTIVAMQLARVRSTTLKFLHIQLE